MYNTVIDPCDKCFITCIICKYNLAEKEQKHGEDLLVLLFYHQQKINSITWKFQAEAEVQQTIFKVHSISFKAS